MWINRNVEKTITDFSKNFPVTILTGARQAGKTSILRRLFKDINYITLDDPIMANLAHKEPEEFLKRYPSPLIIDEVQYAPDLLRYIKILVDEKRSKSKQKPLKTEYFLTGSQNFSLMQNVAESLAGRAGVISLLPLSYCEVKKAHRDKDIKEFILTGGYPALSSGEIREKDLWLSSYLSTYLERDVRNAVQISNSGLRDYLRFLRALALRSGQILVLSNIAQEVGVTINTVKSWLSVLQASQQIHLLEPYHQKITQRLIKSPKIYFIDTGLLLHLLGIKDREDLENSPLEGQIWETFVFSEILKFYTNQGRTNLSIPLYFWRTKDGQEVDFVIEKGGKFILIESKLTQNINKLDLKNIEIFTKQYGENNIQKVVLACNTKENIKFKKNIYLNNCSELENVLL